MRRARRGSTATNISRSARNARIPTCIIDVWARPRAPHYWCDRTRGRSGRQRRFVFDPGHRLGKYGIHSRAEFLADPDAQEKALTDYVNDNIRLLRANGAFAHIGETIDGLKARFPVTRAHIIAAAHREGARATAGYLNKIKANGFSSRGLFLSRQERAIETRLRTFSAARYE